MVSVVCIAHPSISHSGDTCPAMICQIIALNCFRSLPLRWLSNYYGDSVTLGFSTRRPSRFYASQTLVRLGSLFVPFYLLTVGRSPQRAFRWLMRDHRVLRFHLP